VADAVGLAPQDAFSVLPSTLRDDLLEAFNEIVKNYREHKWEPSELNGGKLCEAVYTVVVGWLDGGGTRPARRSPTASRRPAWDWSRSMRRSPTVGRPGS
jgi:hypothetical protein